MEIKLQAKINKRSENKNYFLVDLSRNEKNRYFEYVYEVASYIALYHTHLVRYHMFKFDEELIKKYWRWDTIPLAPSTMGNILRIRKIKWFIQNKITIERKDIKDNWCSDFIHGLIKCGKVNESAGDFPVFEWQSNFEVYDILKTCNFYGSFNKYAATKDPAQRFKWHDVSAILLPHSEDTKEFMAGVFSTGEICSGELDGRCKYWPGYGKFFEGYDNVSSLAKYHIKIESYFKEWGIPIEFKNKHKVFISPIWAALFVDYMPSVCRDKWLKIKHPYLSDIYCPILWKTYVPRDFESNGIPYLKSRRMIFYIHKCEEGSAKKLEMLRISKGLTLLDSRFKEIVREWSKKQCV